MNRSPECRGVCGGAASFSIAFVGTPGNAGRCCASCSTCTWPKHSPMRPAGSWHSGRAVSCSRRSSTRILITYVQHTIFKDVKGELFRFSVGRIGELVSFFSVNGSSITQTVRPQKSKVFILPESSGKWQHSCSSG